MHVLLLNEFFYPDKQGGTATATSNIASALQAYGDVQVSVVTSSHSYRDADGARYASHEVWNDISIHRVSTPNWLRKGMAVRLAGNLLFAWAVAWRALRMPRPDVVLVTTAPLTLPIAARLLKTLKRVPYAYLIYDLDPDRTIALNVKPADSLPVKVLSKVQRRWLHGADRVIAIGRCMQSLLVERYALKRDKVSVIEVGADPDVIRPLAPETRFREAHGLHGFVVLYSGNFGQYHDFSTILDAAAQLKGEQGLHFVLVGGGHKKAEIAGAIQERGLTNVHLLPFVPEEELADLLASANVHLVTLESGMEGLCVPSKFYSCLASGRPVIAIVPGQTEVAMVLTESKSGWQVSPGDVKGLICALQEAREELDQEGAGAGGNARRVFDAQYAMPIVGKKFYETLKSIARP